MLLSSAFTILTFYSVNHLPHQISKIRLILMNLRKFKIPAHYNYKCFRFLTTHKLFDEIPQTNTLILINSNLYSNDLLNPSTFALALKYSNFNLGSRIHSFLVKTNLISFHFVSNSLMNMYAKSSHFHLACKCFDELQNPDVVSWNTILSGFSSCFFALDFVVKMHSFGVQFDAVSFTKALSYSADAMEVDLGTQMHCLAFKYGYEDDIFIGNALITMYMRSGIVDYAYNMFDEKEVKDLVTWNALISGLTQEGNYGFEAYAMFSRMLKEEYDIRPDHVSFASAISACAQQKRLELGTQIHCLALKFNLDNHISVANVLMSMYYKCGDDNSFTKVFKNTREKNVISWTTMISMDGDNAIKTFNRMRLDSVLPNEVTYIGLICAITPDQSLEEGQMIHGICLKTGILSEVNVSNSLISMYAKLRYMTKSRKVFDEMKNKEIISWNALITGYANTGLFDEALMLFSSLIALYTPNQYTFGSILSAITSSQTMSLAYGQRCHCLIVKSGLNTNEYVSGALIDMYTKHGSIEESQKLFNETKHDKRNLISWTAIISAHAKHGDFTAVMNTFKEMISLNIQPDHVTFLAVLMACGGKGKVEMARKFFNEMLTGYGLDPWPEHYSCMVDMLGRAGELAEAEELVKKMPLKLGFSALQSLLGACRIHGDAEMGERVARILMKMEPKESGAYVLMSNLYAERGEWENVAKMRKKMRDGGVKKEVGYSWVDVGSRGGSNHMHKFSSNDWNHEESEKVYGVVMSLGLNIMTLEEEEEEEEEDGIEK